MERTPEQWFQEATRAYLEGHQACAWCHAQHQVHRTENNQVVEYCCNRCDFHVSYDCNGNRFVVIPGETAEDRPAPVTMHDW